MDQAIRRWKVLIPFNSSGAAGMLECYLIVILREQCSQSFRHKHSRLVYPVSGQSVPYYLLCVSTSAKYVCIWLEYVALALYLSASTLIVFTATVALSLLLPETVPVKVSLNRIRLAVSLLTVTAIIFRSEVAILLFCHVAYILLKQIARFGHLTQGITLLTGTIIPAGILGTFIGLGMTIPVDTFFWQSPIYLWPEFSAFLSNILPSDNSLGASAWGTQPWHWYFTSALPRLLMRPFIDIALYLFAISTSAISERALDLLLPNLSYIVIYSLLPHKETRFIFPVVPPLTLAAALSASYIWTRRHRTLLYHIPSIILVLSTLLSALIAHAVLLPLSALSYTGAHALQTLHNNASSLHNLQTINQNSNNTIRVHLDNLSTQTGITRFLQRSTTSQSEGDNWVYDKSENATDLLNPFWWTRFNYAIMESPQLAIGSWDVVSTTGGLGPIRLLRPDERRPKKIPGLEGKEMEFWDDGLDRVAFEMYGHAGHWTSVAARQLLREGYGVHWMLGRSWSWTNGWWADVGWVPKLYILEQRGSLATEALEQHPCPPTL